jgi:hypothetical protein
MSWLYNNKSSPKLNIPFIINTYGLKNQLPETQEELQASIIASYRHQPSTDFKVFSNQLKIGS